MHTILQRVLQRVIQTSIQTVIAVLMMLSASAFAPAADLELAKIDGAKPLNVVFILSDDHRYDVMSFLGHPWVETPAMDAMARDGVYFQNAMVTTSLCSPSRASILTGQYMHNHGVVDNNVQTEPGTVFFPQYLQAAGYQTGYFGKWHMGGHSDEPRPGFDKWVSFRGQGIYYPPNRVNSDDSRRSVADGTQERRVTGNTANIVGWAGPLSVQTEKMLFHCFCQLSISHNRWFPQLNGVIDTSESQK